MNIPKVLLAADNDRDMLEYLHEAFQSQVNVCDQCGHEEPTSTCDSALDLNAYLGHFTTPPQPIYDEAAEQEAFEAVNPMPDQVMKFKGGYAPTGYSAWEAQDFCKKWDGWKQCAQSRAKAGEDK